MATIHKTLIAFSLLLTACTVAPTSPPTSAPSITGVITRSSADRIVIEENPSDTAGSAKAAVRITERTRIFTASGQAASREELREGRRVSAWFEGPVAESYPVQATASAVRLE